MRCSAPSHWLVMALIAGLVLPGSVRPAAGERLGRSLFQPRAVRAARKRTAIKARLSAAERKLHQHRVKLGAVREQIRDTRQQLHTRKVQVVRLSDQVRALQVRVDTAAKRLKSAETRLA